MDDHYQVLGVQKNASKEEIKQAFRKLAMEFHPDKHSKSSDRLRDSATVKFKRLSEAYETLSDDGKRADYNIRRNAYGAHRSNRNAYSHGGGGGGAYNNNPYGFGYGYGGSARTRGGGGGDRMFTQFEIGIRYLTTRSFLLNATFVGLLLGGMYIIDASGKALWKMHNPGKSFEEAMESVEKAKSGKNSTF
ncbi:chaperone protein dnaJ 72 isoform X2 [Andrographis paniculata]|uniref:chaperone protein dnaJ 72 isoform X2 n=1 Tax=Andrographis paniculata TaxID=175694 RepID=UPI0021E8FA5C|nr:chaperone protein dnaJ 72 isoform X2 [Andrographis paniculata]